MKTGVILLGVAAVHALLSKGVALGMILLLFWIKGKQLGFDSEKWDDYALNLPESKAERMLLGVCGAAIAASTLVSYLLLCAMKLKYAVVLAALLLVCSIGTFVHRWRGERGKRLLAEKYAAIRRGILGEREQQNG
ncbi:MAG: hypothetical protein U0J65_09250 [Christensenellales bacterium]|nr:hypothetical protein [Christensenellales bacterium]